MQFFIILELMGLICLLLQVLNKWEKKAREAE